MNPAFKRKSSSEDSGSSKKLPKTEDSGQKENTTKGKENDQKKNIKPEKEVKHKPEKVPVKEKEEPMEVDSPVKSLKKKKKCVIDSDSEEESPKNVKKKKAIISDSDEESPVKQKPSTSEKSPAKKKIEQEIKNSPKKEEKNKSSPKKLEKSQSSPKKEADSPKKSEKKPVSNFFTPKSAKAKSKVEKTEEAQEKQKSEEVEEKVSAKETDVNDGSPKAKAPAAESKSKSAFAGFFSPKTTPGGAKRNEGGSDYEKKVLASSYHPVDDSFWTRGEATPFLALAKTLESIEATSSRLKTIEVLSNYLRSVMVQTPADLQASVYMTLNRLAPAWEGIELGIGESLLIKAIANSTGRSAAQIKTDMGKLGDLGLVAEQSRGGQRTMFQPKQLTVQAVFEKLREIAALTGHSSGTKKVEKIQSLLVACRGSEARFVNHLPVKILMFTSAFSSCIQVSDSNAGW